MGRKPFNENDVVRNQRGEFSDQNKPKPTDTDLPDTGATDDREEQLAGVFDSLQADYDQDSDTRAWARGELRTLTHGARFTPKGSGERDDTRLIAAALQYAPEGPGGSRSDYLYNDIVNGFEHQTVTVPDRTALEQVVRTRIGDTALDPRRSLKELGLDTPDATPPLAGVVQRITDDPDQTPENRRWATQYMTGLTDGARFTPKGSGERDDSRLIAEAVRYAPAAPGGSRSDYLHHDIVHGFDDRTVTVPDRNRLEWEVRNNILATSLDPERSLKELRLDFTDRPELQPVMDRIDRMHFIGESRPGLTRAGLRCAVADHLQHAEFHDTAQPDDEENHRRLATRLAHDPRCRDAGIALNDVNRGLAGMHFTFKDQAASHPVQSA